MNSSSDSSSSDKLNSLLQKIFNTASNLKVLFNSHDICDQVRLECKKSLKQSADLLVKVELTLKDQVKENNLQVILTKINFSGNIGTILHIFMLRPKFFLNRNVSSKMSIFRSLF